MKKNAGFTFFEILVVLVILAILATLSIITVASHGRMVKTDDAATALYSLARQGRIQAITRRQFYGLVVNTDTVERTLTLNNSVLALKFPAQSVSLVDMGNFTMNNDEKVSFSKILPPDVRINFNPDLPTGTAMMAFPQPERNFTFFNFGGNPIFTCYFDPAGRAVNAADGNGTQVYMNFYFSARDITATAGPTLLRAISLYGATGGVKAWRYIPLPMPQWRSQLS